MSKLSVIGLVLLATAGCKVQTGVNSSGGPSIGGGDSSGGGGGGGGGEGGAGGETCQNPQNHCLDADDVFIGDTEFKNNYISVHVAKAQGQPNSAGETPFMKVGDGSTQTTKFFWKTHPMTDAEVKVGALMIALDYDHEGMYRAPTSREQATTTNWFLGRIVSVDGLPQGQVLVSGGYKVARNALRAVDGDNSPRLTTTTAEDKYFVRPEYWFVGDSPLPDSNYISVQLAMPVQAPSAKTGGEGQFLKLGTGELVWTKNAWPQRLATQADLKPGSYAIALDAEESGVYGPPNSREKAFDTNWFIAKVTDVGQAYKGNVTLSGQYQVKIDGARVIAK